VDLFFYLAISFINIHVCNNNNNNNNNDNNNNKMNKQIYLL
jgi:hypothetical protein